MADTIDSVILALLRQYNIGDAGLVSDIVGAIADGRLDENSGTFLDDVGVVLSNNQYIQTRFKGNAERVKNGLQALPLTEILRLEKGYTTALQAANMPPGFYDDPATDFQNFIGRNTSPDEVNRRIQQGYEAVRNADQEVVRQFKELGIYEGDLAAYFLDPARTEGRIASQVEQARIAAQGRQQAGIQLTGQQAEQLAQAGVTERQARETFQTLSDQQSLFQPQMAGEEAVSQEEQVAAAFGTSAAARQRVETRRRRRAAQFEQGGRFAQSNQFQVGGLSTIGE